MVEYSVVKGFMELSLLETKTGTNNNGQTTGLAFESERTRWIITEGEKRFSGCISTLTEVLVGVDIRTVTDDRNRYPKIDIWESRFGSDSYRRRSPSDTTPSLPPVMRHYFYSCSY